MCYFDYRDNEHGANYYEPWLDTMGYVRVLPKPTFYQLKRLFDVSTSCLGCGICTDVCPVDIPVSSVCLITGGAVQKQFDYVPGRDLEEAIPLTTLRSEDLAGVGG